jgi:hypothetical protein
MADEGTTTGKSDFFDEMRAALPEAHVVALKQAFLAGQLAQEKLDEMATDPRGQALGEAVDALRKALADAGPFLDSLPEPLRTVLSELEKAVDVAEAMVDALGSIHQRVGQAGG